MHDGHNGVGCGQCKSPHHEESTPRNHGQSHNRVLARTKASWSVYGYLHSPMQSASNLVVLLETRAASEDLWEPELSTVTVIVLILVVH